MEDALRRLIAGQWRFHWWGWEVCIDHDSADVVANVFTALGGLLNFDQLKATFDALVKGVSLGIAAGLGLLVLYGFGLGQLIRAVNGPAGVCIQGNWPTPWVGAFVWAVRR